jgi:hypothetical protein
MLLRVLKEDFSVKFRGYGIITVPKGTPADSKDYADPHVKYCPVNEFGWINDYPGQCDEMKSDAIKHGIMVPKERLILALRVLFLYGDPGYCRDIYRNIYGNRKYCRMESRVRDKVQWLTVTGDWEEPDCPLRSDMLIQLTDKDDRVVITEQQIKEGEEYAIDKHLPLSWENAGTEEQQQFMSSIYNL